VWRVFAILYALSILAAVIVVLWVTIQANKRQQVEHAEYVAWRDAKENQDLRDSYAAWLAQRQTAPIDEGDEL
jgi:hypothetical protein